MSMVVWTGHALIIFTASACAFLCYTNSLNGEWTFDDNFAIVGNEDVKPTGRFANLFLNDFWGQDISKPDSHKSYRPITSLSFRLNYIAGGGDTFGFHLVNVLLHCMVTAGVYCLAQSLLDSKGISFLSALFFATHPVHTEAVSSIVGRTETLSSIFYIGAILSYKKWCFSTTGGIYVALTLICFWLSTLSKESGFTVIGVLFAQDIFLHRQPGITKRFLVLLCGGLAYVLLRKWLTVSFTLHNFRHLENPIAFADSAVTRMLSLSHLHARYALLLVFPLHLSADYSFDAIPLVESVFDARNFLTLLSYGIIIATLLYSAKVVFYSNTKEAPAVGHILLYLVLFGIFSFLPASNFFFYVGTMLAERLLYLPSVPYCILQAWAIVAITGVYNRVRGESVSKTGIPPQREKTVRKRIRNQYTENIVTSSATTTITNPVSTHDHSKSARPRLSLRRALLWAIATLIVLLYAGRTRARDAEWKSEHLLFMSAAKVAPGSAKVWQNVGILYRRTQEWDTALECFARARKIEPTYCELDYWVGLTILNRGDLWASLPLLSESLDCIYTRVQAVQALHTIYGSLVSNFPQNATLYTEWGMILSRINKTSEAAVQHYQAGVLLHNRGEYVVAKYEFIKAISLFNQLNEDEDLLDDKSIVALCRTQLWLGATYYQLNDSNTAIEQIQQATSFECKELEQDVLPILLNIYMTKVADGTITHYQRLGFADALAKFSETERAVKQLLEAGIGLRNSDLRGNAHATLQAFSLARELAAPVAALATLHAEALYWAAVVNWELGNVVEAKNMLQEAAKTSDSRVRKLATDNLIVLGYM